MSHHHHVHSKNETNLWLAIIANMVLTVGQILGGIFSGSLSLIADALHNLSDAASLVIALIAIRFSKKPPDQFKTFGYKRAETIAALINLTTLIIIGLYLCYEAIERMFNPSEVHGWTMVLIAGIALIVDIFTAVMTYKGSKDSLNMKAAFLHNLTDALASVGVIVGGILIIYFKWFWIDPIITFVIAGYVLYHGATALPKVIHILMEGAPEGIEIDEVISTINKVAGVIDVHHVHIWQLDEQRNALEAHIVLEDKMKLDFLKVEIKKILLSDFNISHSTLEFEFDSSLCK